MVEGILLNDSGKVGGTRLGTEPLLIKRSCHTHEPGVVKQLPMEGTN